MKTRNSKIKPKKLHTPIQNRIRRLRFDADEMTQAELAKRVGVTRQTVLAIEWAERFPELLPDDRLEIRLTDVPGGRRAELRATGPRHAALEAVDV